MDPEVLRPETIGGLIRGILNDLRTLVKEELALARVEFREHAGRARTAAMSLGIAAGALIFGVAFLLIALAVGIAELAGWPAWAGFLIVSALLSTVGIITYSSGRKQLRTLQAAQKRSIASMKENSEWIAKRLYSVRK